MSHKQVVQRQPEPSPSPETTDSTEAETETNDTPAGLIVADGPAGVEPGQMTKSEFLGELRTQICNTATATMADSGMSADNCPWIEMYLRFYERLGATRIERDLLRYTPEAAGATSARDYFPHVTARVQRSVAVWLETGEITGVPGGIPSGLPGFGMVGKVMFKARNGGSQGNPNPAAIQARLGAGQALAPATQSRMGQAFGHSFSHVRVHHDSTASRLSTRHNARAFTVGHHVAFDRGEYQPGTPMGEALIAHELAHVVQQRGATQSISPMAQNSGGTSALEKDADRSAIGAIASLWGGAKGTLKNTAKNTMPRLRSGIQLSRCQDSTPSRQQPRSIQYETNLGRVVNSSTSGYPGQPDISQQTADAVLGQIGLTGRVNQIGPPTNSYNCHGYTFSNSSRWVNDDQVPRILTDNGYSVTTTPAVNDIVIYRFSGNITHSGVITGVSGNTVTEVTSKWGRAPLYRHAPDLVPPTYGPWRAYTTTRSGGHTLRRQ